MGVSSTPSLQGDGTHVFGPFQRLLLGIVALNSWYVGCCFTPLGLQLGIVQWLPFSRASRVGRDPKKWFAPFGACEDSFRRCARTSEKPVFF